MKTRSIGSATRRGLILAGGLAVATLGAGCGAIAKAPTPAPTTEAQGLCASFPTLCAGAPTPAPATPTANDLEGPVGTAFTDTDENQNVMTVTLTGVIDPAHDSTGFEPPDNGNRYVAAKFSITGTSGTFSDDANSDAAIIGSDGQTYSVDFDSVRGCTNFNSGEFSVTPGHTEIGCVVFQVPNGVKVAQVQWGAGLDSAPAVWDVS